MIGQNPFRFQLDEQRALPSTIIYAVAQDPKGYMWMTSNAGLFRYDGFEHTIYRSSQQTSLPGGSIEFDQYGRVWYENFDGFLYYVQEETLHALPNQSSPMGFVPYGLTAKHLFVVQKKGVDVFDLQTLQLLKTIPISIEEPEHATVLGNNFYLISEGVIYRIDESFQLTSTNFFRDKSWRVKYINTFKDKLYVVSKNNEEKQLYFFTPELTFVNTIPIKEVPYIHGSRVLDGYIMIYSSHGVFIYNEKGELQFNQRAIFPDQNISSIERDYQNNYWISTVYNGVWVIPDLKNTIYPLIGDKPSRLVKEANGYLIGTHTGDILRLDTHKEKQQLIKTNKEKVPVSYIDYDSLENRLIYASNGFSIVPQGDFRLKESYNIAVKQLKPIDGKYTAYAASGMCGLFLLNDQNVSRTSTWDSLFTRYTTSNQATNARLFKGVRGKSVDYHAAHNQLVFATSIGVFLQTPTKQVEVQYEQSSIYANDVCWIGDDLYMLTTKGTVLCRVASGDIRKVNETLGLGHEEFKRIKKYGHDLLLIGDHSVYLYKVDSHTLLQTASNIGKTVVIDAIKDSDSTLLLLTKEGLLEVNLNTVLQKVPARFYVNSVRVNDRIQIWSEPFSVGFTQNNLTVAFSILDYTGTVTPLYYRINKGEWVRIDANSRTIGFPSLSSGDYEIAFKINEEISPQRIQFSIATPFWKAWWFYAFITAIVGVLVMMYYRHKSKLMEQQIALLNEKVMLEKNLSKSVLTSIKSQMNPHFFYNALNTIQAYIFTNDKQRANSYLAKFSKLTRIILEMSEQETISLQEEIEALKIYLDLEKMRFTDSFEYTIEVDDSLDKEAIELPPMLIQPYVENAIKHGLLHRVSEKKLCLLFKRQSYGLQVIVDDNGIGRKRSEELNKIKEEKHQSFATKANAKRLEILNKRLDSQVVVHTIDKYDGLGNATGTRVELTIPIN